MYGRIAAETMIISIRSNLPCNCVTNALKVSVGAFLYRISSIDNFGNNKLMIRSMSRIFQVKKIIISSMREAAHK